jgi:uncharacterized membrane protein (DUF373 family)
VTTDGQENEAMSDEIRNHLTQHQLVTRHLSLLTAFQMKAMKQQGTDHLAEIAIVRGGHPTLRKYLELVQDLIVLGLCAALFVAMLVKLFHLGQVLVRDTDFAAVIADILFIIVRIELFRLLIIYLEEHRVSVSTMVEVGIVSTLREVILKGAMEVDWRQMLVMCAFILTLGVVLRYAGVRSGETGNALAGEDAAKGAV